LNEAVVVYYGVPKLSGRFFYTTTEISEAKRHVVWHKKSRFQWEKISLGY